MSNTMLEQLKLLPTISTRETNHDFFVPPRDGEQLGLEQVKMSWPLVAQVVSVPHTQADYERAIATLDELIDVNYILWFTS